MTFYDLWVLAVLVVCGTAFVAGWVLIIRSVVQDSGPAGVEGHGTSGEVVPLTHDQIARPLRVCEPIDANQ